MKKYIQDTNITGKQHTTFIDMYPHFQGYKASRLWVHPSDHHPNEIAHRLTAEVLAKEIHRIARE